MIKRIVVGSDGSSHAQRAVAFAADLAHQLRAEVLLVHATGDVAPARSTADTYLMHVARGGAPGDEHSVERVARSDWARPLIAARVPWGVDVRYGWAPEVLAKTAEEIGAQVIVVGAGPRTAPAALSVGTVLSRRTAVPVIVVPDESELIELHAVEQPAAVTPTTR